MWCWVGGGEKITNLVDRHELWFSAEFIWFPLSDFTVDWSGCICVTCREYEKSEDHQYDGGWEGIIIRCTNPQRVWVLTGEYNMQGNGYLGRWPD